MKRRSKRASTIYNCETATVFINKTTNLIRQGLKKMRTEMVVIFFYSWKLVASCIRYAVLGCENREACVAVRKDKHSRTEKWEWTGY